ncbi:MAG: cofactor-independent phosphoglycerate mutase [Planctomycetota bacterium]|nr:cofactor-independent phosphoglycerate mutase [Planctomycetota bacterium]
MKYVIVIPDGAADFPLTDLDGRTPLEAANTPNMDWVALNGRQGRIVTVPEGFSAGTGVATLSLLGYDPGLHYSGRAALEAAARGLTAETDQLIFRCNLVTIRDGRMEDFAGGHLSQPEADRLIADLNDLLAGEGCAFHPGVSYRNLMMIAGARQMRITCQAPDEIPNQPVADYLPRGAGADRIRTIMRRAGEMLVEHPVNRQRIAAGQRPATDIWLWGPGRPTILEPFAKRFGPSGVVITAVDVMRGLAVCMGMRYVDVAGATAYLDTSYAAKGRAAVDALAECDLVIVHIEAPDEAGHAGDAQAKIRALELIDQYIVAPLLQAVRPYDDWRFLIAPDHPTPVSTRVHSAAPPPFCCAGCDIEAEAKRGFGESHAAAGGLLIDPGYTLMEYFIRRRQVLPNPGPPRAATR